MTGKLTWMPWYIADWLHDRAVKNMSRVARSMYFDLLNHEWIGGPLPDDLDQIADILGELRRSVAPHWASIRARFTVDSSSRLVHEKLESLRIRARIKSEKSAKAAEIRHSRHANASPQQHDGAVPSEKEKEEEIEKRSEEAPATAKPVAPKVKVKVKGKKATKPKSERPRWQEVVAVYAEGWKELHSADGHGPAIDGPDVSALARLYDDLGADETITLVRRFVSDSDAFIAKRGHILRDIESRLNAYRAKPATATGAASKTHFRAPMKHQAETKDETHDL